MIDIVVNGKRHVGIAAVHGTGGRIDEMLDLSMPTTFQNVHESFDVAFRIGVRVHEGIAHTGLSGEMDDAPYRVVGEEVTHALSVGEIELHEAESLTQFQLREASVFNRTS